MLRSIQAAFRPQHCRRRLAPLLCLWPALAAAQPAGPPVAEQRQQVHVAASARALWLAVVTESGSQMFFRSAGGGFDLGRAASRRVAAMTTLDRDLLVFFADGTAYRYLPDISARPTAEAVLPQNQLPVDLVVEDALVYAIIPSSAAAELPPAPADDAIPTSQAFDPDSAPLSLAKYDGRTWSAVAPLPPLARPPTDARLRPRLYVRRGKVLLFTPAEQPGQILCFYFDAQDNRWIARGNVPLPGLTAFWVVSFRNELTFVAASPGPAGRETIRASRLPGDPTQADPTTWRPANLRFSDLPPRITLMRYIGAVGFNQHLGLLAVDANGETYLRFALIDAAPAEPTQSVSDVLAQPGMLRDTHRFVQRFTLILLAGVAVGLFVFRRGSLFKRVELPAGCALALNVQRLVGWLIDFGPFTLASAVLLDVPLSQGLWTLAKWGISPDAQGGMPEEDVLLWWGFSVVCYTTYMLVMELIARRTVGKVLARAHLLSETGTRPAPWQILTRNLTRLIELTPQFWFLFVLVLISRNRQRMGDIFARTLVIRLTPVAPAVTDRKNAGPHRPPPSEPSPGDAPAPPDADEFDSSGAEPPDTQNGESSEESSRPDGNQRRSSEPGDQ